MFGLALEGGGAKGSYHAGVLKACLDLGLSFDAVTGSSIGAINGALIAQGDADKLCDFWLSISFDQLFCPQDIPLLSIINGQIDSGIFHNLKDNIHTLVKAKGIDTSKIFEMLKSFVDSDRLYASPTEYGLVTVSFPRLKPLSVYKEDIPASQLYSHILASATFPGFQLTEINGVKYIDGGVYDSCPIGMLLNKGCDRVLAVRVFGGGVFRAPKETSANIEYIIPTDDLGPILGFNKEQTERNINLGYYDAMRHFRHLAGKKYCIENLRHEDIGFDCLSHISEHGISALSLALKVSSDKPGKRLLFEELLPKIAEKLDMPDEYSYNDIIFSALENRAERISLERFKIYELSEFISAVCSSLLDVSEKNPVRRHSTASLIDLFLSVLYHAV